MPRNVHQRRLFFWYCTCMYGVLRTPVSQLIPSHSCHHVYPIMSQESYPITSIRLFLPPSKINEAFLSRNPILSYYYYYLPNEVPPRYHGYLATAKTLHLHSHPHQFIRTHVKAHPPIHTHTYHIISNLATAECTSSMYYSTSRDQITTSPRTPEANTAQHNTILCTPY